MNIKELIRDFEIGSYELLSSAIFILPRWKLFNTIKSNFLRIQGSEIVKWITYYPGIKISPGINIKIGNYVDLVWGIIITTKRGVEIGDRTLIGYDKKYFLQTT